MIETLAALAKGFSETMLADLAKDVPKDKLNLKELDKPLLLNNETNKIPTRNQELEGKTHPETGVPFEKKTVENADGKDVDVVVPTFDSTFDAQLEPDSYEASDKDQFSECNKQLKEEMKKDPELAAKFTKEQYEQIMDGETPDGYTWHHDAEKGKIQLVDSTVHAKTGHTGGKTIWGGGSENR